MTQGVRRKRSLQNVTESPCVVHKECVISRFFFSRLFSHTPSSYYLRFERRLASFEAWPTQMYQTAEEMAHAGFVYTQGANGVCCFQCGVRLRQWASHDDPWVAHHKWSPHCDYLKLTGLVKHKKKLQLHYLCEENVNQKNTNGVA
ncbi:baculoviral IAP repeat-containing protein 3-like [Haliotis rufescens]|uniref:baculoviral IAP repeat-containing protein 3-like n=1 Tax=Haliotis rufescens TaxID=6454 RepID=UPI00201F604B|nr:baculoviral IAP repeat-containing protein 3-like [Haliotis rufescens]